VTNKIYIAEKIFALLILLYIIFLLRFRWSIVTSKSYLRQYWKLRGLKKGFVSWFQMVGKLKVAMGVVLLVNVIWGGIYVNNRLNPDKRFQRLVDGCVDLVAEERYEQALIDMTNALRIRPDYARGHYFLASIHMKTGNMDAGESALWQVVRIQADYENSLRMLESILERNRDSWGLKMLGNSISAKYPVRGKILEAKSLMLEKKFTLSIKTLEDAVKMAPENGEVDLLLGNLFVLEGRPQEAMESYRRSIKKEFGSWRAHFALARLLLDNGETEAALSELSYARSMNPDVHLPALALARVHMGKKEYDQAVRVLNDILERDENNEQALYWLGVVQMTEQRFQEAVNSFERISGDITRKRDYLYYLALSYNNTGKLILAMEKLESLKKIEPLDLKGLRLFSRVALALGRTDRGSEILMDLVRQGKADKRDRELLARLDRKRDAAIKGFRKVRSRHKDLEAYLRRKDYQSLIQGAKKALRENKIKAPFYNLLGVAYLATGSLKEAEKNFFLSYNEQRANPAPLMNLVNIYVKTGNISEAERLLIDHNRSFSKDDLGRLQLGKVYFITGRLDEAVSLFNDALMLNSDNVSAHHQLGLCYRLKGDMKASLSEYLEAIRLNPKHALSLNDAANIYADNREMVEKALEFAKRAVDAAPLNGNIHDTLGWVYFLKGEYLMGLTSFLEARRLNPYLRIIPYHLGLAQFKLGRFVEAEQSLKLALSMKGPFREVNKAGELLREISSIVKSKHSDTENQIFVQ
jgi:tetratricopeptide (TPR) repeat protein